MIVSRVLQQMYANCSVTARLSADSFLVVRKIVRGWCSVGRIRLPKSVGS